MARIFTALFILMFVSSAAFSATLTGVVKDAEDGEALPGANVKIEGTNYGATTDLNGTFTIWNVPEGQQVLVVSYVGFKTHTLSVVPGDERLVIQLRPEIFRGKEVTVVANRARLRETPVAFTNVEKADMEKKLGSRDLPMILNETPGVYATEQGGGAGDARINIRGFDQRNVAVMINGVPVNDMENGWVYWSNWDGLGNATSSIQVQRGLGASNLAIASVGGTMNIITDAAKMNRGFKVKQEVGDGSFYKTSVNFSSGLLNDRTAFSVGITRKLGDGLPDQGWSDAWSYFGALSYLASESHKIDLYLVGAPQRHGQRLYKQDIATFDAEYARELGVDVTGARNYGQHYNPNWGRNPFSTYREYYNGSVHDARDTDVIMERENYYHKPQMNLNWYWTPSETFILSNVFYVSQGKGGGTGRLGRNPGSTNDGTIDWQRVATDFNIEKASDANPELVAANEVGSNEVAAQTIIRNSVNDHFWYGYLGTSEYRIDGTWKISTGLDLRYYKGEHWREVRNLMGADYYVFPWDNNASTSVKRLGDKVSYHNDGLTRWAGLFGQIEGQFDKFTAFLSASGSVTGYKRIDYFRPKVNGDWDETDWSDFKGYNIKIGGNYNLSETLNLYANVGRLSKAPIFDSVYHFDNSKYDPTFNEKVNAFELGAGYLNRGVFSGNANFYFTRWNDRSWPKSVYSANLDQSFRFLLQGIDARHMGVEFDLKARPHEKFEIRGMVSLGDWEWINDANVTFSLEEDPSVTNQFQIYADGLKVGDSAQKTFALSGSVFPAPGLYASLGMKRYMDHYAKFDPANRTDPADRQQSWKVPNYNLVDFHAGYTFPGNVFGNGQLQLQLNVFNLLNETYISDADDGNMHDASTASVFLGLPRRWNISLAYDY